MKTTTSIGLGLLTVLTLIIFANQNDVYLPLIMGNAEPTETSIPVTVTIGPNPEATLTATFGPTTTATQTSTPTGDASVVLNVTDHTKSGTPGGTITYNLTVRNPGTADGNYSLTIEQSCDEEIAGCFEVTNAPSSFGVVAGQTASFQISVTLPASAQDGASDLTIVRARLNGDDLFSEAILSTTVQGHTPTATGTATNTATATGTATNTATATGTATATISPKVTSTSTATASASPTATPTNTIEPIGECSPAYANFCIPPAPPDLNCPEIREQYGCDVEVVIHPDPHNIDRDGDGIGCECSQ
ncbi:MAG: hypothetical protein HC837_15585 [Chloroflexaceae bacterium]|nr:hypothetical protein [Chloroflexaceae bacterium]